MLAIVNMLQVIIIIIFRNAYKILIGNLKVRDQLEDPGVDGRIILKLILGK
jgi:hypothetical protein